MTYRYNNLIINNYKTLTADRMCMTGYSVYCEGEELQEGFSMNNLDAPRWIPAGSTKKSPGGSFIISSIWISLSYYRTA